MNEMIICEVKNKTFVFPKELKLVDGTYVLIKNTGNYFSLFEKDVFDKLFEKFKDNEDERLIHIKRFFIVNSAVVDMKDNKIKVPIVMHRYISSDKLYISRLENRIDICNTYLSSGNNDLEDE